MFSFVYLVKVYIFFCSDCQSHLVPAHPDGKQNSSTKPLARVTPHAWTDQNRQEVRGEAPQAIQGSKWKETGRGQREAGSVGVGPAQDECVLVTRCQKGERGAASPTMHGGEVRLRAAWRGADRSRVGLLAVRQDFLLTTSPTSATWHFQKLI